MDPATIQSSRLATGLKHKEVHCATLGCRQHPESQAKNADYGPYPPIHQEGWDRQEFPYSRSVRTINKTAVKKDSHKQRTQMTPNTCTLLGGGKVFSLTNSQFAVRATEKPVDKLLARKRSPSIHLRTALGNAVHLGLPKNCFLLIQKQSW
jgi:hypothetical protein